MPTRERRRTHHDPMSPAPALVVGYRTPNPITQLDECAAYFLFVQVLTESESSRLHKRLVKTGLVSAIAGMIGPFDNWLDMRDPVLFNLITVYPNEGDPDALLDVIEDTIEEIHDDLTEDELVRARTMATARYLRATDGVLTRALTIAPLEQQRGRAELINEIPFALAHVTAEDVKNVAGKWFGAQQRAVLDWQPGAGR
jgi:predicted Zn-dependent peptidase